MMSGRIRTNTSAVSFAFSIASELPRLLTLTLVRRDHMLPRHARHARSRARADRNFVCRSARAAVTRASAPARDLAPWVFADHHRDRARRHRLVAPVATARPIENAGRARSRRDARAAFLDVEFVDRIYNRRCVGGARQHAAGDGRAPLGGMVARAADAAAV